MPFLSPTEAFSRFEKFGRNSSHFVWFLCELQYYECANGWVFAFRQVRSVTIFALEPLIPVEGLDVEAKAEEFEEAWSEIQREVKPKIAFFISVYQKFFEILTKKGFQSLNVGREPYVALEDCVPTGKSGKGVRAARNQALRAGVRVEEWTFEQIKAHPTMERDMQQIMLRWKSRFLLQMGGFLNTVDPFTRMESRKFFLAFSERRGLEAFLVATPIPAKNSYFLEDLVIRPHATRGTGELLTLETLVGLAEAKYHMASLGVVAITQMDEKSAVNMDKKARFFLVEAPKFLSKFYNVSGLEMFRKRFKPKVWETIYLSMYNSPDSGVTNSMAWLKSMLAMLSCWEPKIHLNRHWIAGTVIAPVKRHPVSFGIIALTTALFAVINQGGALPDWALNSMAFTAAAPLWQWPWRSIVSDLVYFDATHFLLSSLALLVALRWMEKTHSIRFTFLLVILTSIFDDIINQLVLVWPYSLVHPRLFQTLVLSKDVGTSLWVSTFIGLQLCSLKKNREILFTVISVGVVLCFSFSAARLSNLILNLNHFLFLSLGYIIGKLKFERERAQSRKVAKMKAPESKSSNLAAEKRRHNKERSAADQPAVIAEESSSD